MTAHFLIESIVPLEAGDVVVVHSAAGGVGLLLTQMASARGCAWSARRRPRPGENSAMWGTDVVVRARGTSARSFGPRVRGSVLVVFDSIGKDTFEDSLVSLARRGTLVVFGQSSGPVPPFDLRRLQPPGSVFLTRPGLADYTSTRDELLERAGAVFSMLASGELDVRVHERFPLARAADAHRAGQRQPPRQAPARHRPLSPLLPIRRVASLDKANDLSHTASHEANDVSQSRARSTPRGGSHDEQRNHRWPPGHRLPGPSRGTDRLRRHGRGSARRLRAWARRSHRSTAS